MDIILNILIITVAVGLATWLLWNILEVVYHTVMIVFYTIAYVVISIFEAIAFVVKWTFIKPFTSLMKIVK